jgi:hypothetical protein
LNYRTVSVANTVAIKIVDKVLTTPSMTRGRS